MVMMEDKKRSELEEVGRISFEALQYAKGQVKEGASLLELAESVEKFIEGKGMGFAFPINISINERAAHYTPPFKDAATFSASDLVKLDLGARRQGAVGDCALTVDLSQKNLALVEATEAALEAALSTVKAGREVTEIGREVEKIATAKGFSPIRNLGGHGIEEGELHASVFIPNFDNGDTTELEEGQVIAVEVFLTTGAGYVVDSDVTEIFQKIGPTLARSEDTRRIAAFIDKNYGTYPFSLRWLSKAFDSEFKIKRALSELSSLGALEPFPVLVEKTGGMVAQAEKELIVEKDSCSILTK